jgi:hypothetical protein
MSMRRLHLILALVPLFVCACGSETPEELTASAQVSIAAGDWQKGLAGFEKALEKLTPADAQYMQASLGRCRALARLEPAKGKSEFLKLAEAQKSKVEFQDFHLMVGDFLYKREFLTAIDMMESAKAMYPGAPKFKEMADSVVKASKAAGDSRALDRLRTLGYL